MFSVPQQKVDEVTYFESRRTVSATMPKVVLVDAQHPQRADVEALVKTVFRNSFGANLTSFYPYFLVIMDAQGKSQAAVGLRPGNQQLFCEHYLADKANKILGSPREDMVEIGNLAIAGAGQIRWTIAALTAFLQGVGFSKVLFTITPLLKNSFARMGLPLTHLAPAKVECLPRRQAEEWGGYYECHPAVYAGNISTGFSALSSKVQSNDTLRSIWQDAYSAGKEAAFLISGSTA